MKKINYIKNTVANSKKSSTRVRFLIKVRLFICVYELLCYLNPYPAELFQLYFSSFRAGIATQFPAPNVEKYIYLWKIDISNIEFSGLTKYVSKTNFSNLVLFLLLQDMIETVYIRA